MPYICMILRLALCLISAIIKLSTENKAKRKEAKQMKTYKIYVNGMYVGTEDFTRSEVTAIESDQDIKLIEK